MESQVKISVIIPLYNKAASVEATLRSVVSQSYKPCEIIVVDDGSTDGSAERVASLNIEGLRIIQQPNGGVSRARNRGAAEAKGTHLAFLDADDQWECHFLATLAAAATQFPLCGLYSAAYHVVGSDGGRIVRSAHHSGVVENFFAEVMQGFVCLPSASLISRKAFEECGGFPAGMKLCEDSYLWICIADHYPVYLTSEPLATYHLGAENRSSAIYVAEQTEFSFDNFKGAEGERCRGEFIARCVLGKAVTLAVKGDKEFARHAERHYAYTRLHRRALWRLRIIRRTPTPLRGPINKLFQKIGWIVNRNF